MSDTNNPYAERKIMRFTIRLSDTEVQVLREMMEEFHLDYISDAVRKLISVRQTSDSSPNSQETQYKMIVRHLSDISRKLDKLSNQDEDDEPPPPTRRSRRKPYDYRQFEAFMDQHKDDEHNPDLIELCRMHPDFLKRYQESNF